MKRGLVFTIEALFLAGVLISLLFVQINEQEDQINQTKINLLNLKISDIKYNNSIHEPPIIQNRNQICKNFVIYDYDQNRILDKRYCEGI